jgi:hypothetical protein
MPRLVRLYCVSVAIGFAIACVFVAGLLALDVAGLRHLVLGSSSGWLAGGMLVMFNGIVFSGVQFGYAVMAMAHDDGRSGGGGIVQRLFAPSAMPSAVRVRVQARDTRPKSHLPRRH